MGPERVIELPGEVLVSIEDPRYQQKWWLRGQYYESDLLNYIRAHDYGGTFIDGGACIGNHTLFFARFCADEVFAIEPVQRNIEHLMRNVTLSGLDRKVVPIQTALAERQGRGAMVHFGKLNLHEHYRLESGEKVDVTTLDEIMAQARFPITVVKLDIEGGELAALKGGLAILEEQSPTLFIEMHQKYGGVQALDAILGPLGYQRGHRFCASPTYEYIKSKH